jgi:thiol-disulfide isomerase/thioredoxin
VSYAGVVVLVVALLVASAYGVVRQRRSGRMRPASGSSRRRVPGADVLGADVLGADALGERVTLVQFSSAFCRPCVATRHLLGDVAGKVPGVRHVEVDAESHLELVRRLNIASTPTTLLLDRAGVVRNRAVGVPRRDEVLAAIDAIGQNG